MRMAPPPKNKVRFQAPFHKPIHTFSSLLSFQYTPAERRLWIRLTAAVELRYYKKKSDGWTKQQQKDWFHCIVEKWKNRRTEEPKKEFVPGKNFVNGFRHSDITTAAKTKGKKVKKQKKNKKHLCPWFIHEEHSQSRSDEAERSGGQIGRVRARASEKNEIRVIGDGGGGA